MIDTFRGDYAFLSNFYRAKVQLGQLYFPSVENAYHAAKTINVKERAQFIYCSAKRAKQLGRKITLRNDWANIKLQIMENLVLQKFTHHLVLKNKLLNTGNVELIEGNWWNDTFWGVCKGQGENHLGKILMKVRTFCQSITNIEKMK